VTNTHRDLLTAYVDAYNRADWQQLAQYVSSDYVHHSGDQVRDLAGFVDGSVWFRNAFPDLAVEVQDMVTEGDRTAMRFVLRATHRVSVFGEEPTDGDLALDGTTIYRFVDGIIVEDWEMMDEGQLRRQLGV